MAPTVIHVLPLIIFGVIVGFIVNLLWVACCDPWQLPCWLILPR